jgi:hypothetical protein
MLSILLPGGMAFFCRERIRGAYTFISAIVVFTVIMETVTYIFKLMGTNNMPLFHLYTYGEATFIALYYYRLYSQRKIRRVYLVMLVVFLVFSLVALIAQRNLYEFNSLQRSVECVWMIILALIFYSDLFNKSNVPNLLKYPHYWLVSGLLLYFAGTFFLNIVGQIAIMSNEFGYNAYDIHSVLNIFLNIIYTIVLWMGSRELTSER